MENILKKAKLTGVDYLQNPIPLLAMHPDFNPHVLNIVNKLMDLETDQLAQIDVSNLGRRIRKGEPTSA